MKNLEEKRGKPARIVLGDPLPDDVEILPSPETLEECCSVASESEGVARTPVPDEKAVEDDDEDEAVERAEDFL